VDALRFQLARFQAQVQAAPTVTAREKLAEDCLRKLQGMGLERSSIMRRHAVFNRVAEELKLPEQWVHDMARKLLPARRMPGAAAVNREAVAEFLSPKIKALHMAEEQLIGCVLLRPEIFRAAVVDGRSLDEALTATDFLRPEAAKLYSLITARLMDQQEVTLAGLLADLAQDGELELAKLATRAELLASAQAGEGNPEALQDMAAQAAGAMLAHQRDQQYREPRGAVAAVAGGDGEAALLRRVAEHNLANRGRPKIVRPRA
jgi:hypothetical protein